MGNNVQKFYVAGSLKGDPFRYEDFTPEQLEALKVKGDPFTYEDFTEDQLALLKGEPGEDGQTPFISEITKTWHVGDHDTKVNAVGPTGFSSCFLTITKCLYGNHDTAYVYEIFDSYQDSQHPRDLLKKLHEAMVDYDAFPDYYVFDPTFNVYRITALSGYGALDTIGLVYIGNIQGDSFTYEDFTLEQLESLRGVNGKTAYEYAVEHGYTGTEEEFAEKLASDTPVAVPESAVYQVTYAGAAYDPSTFQTEAELHTGDVLIATNESNVKTGYTYDETNGWIAMDGNVYADNVLLKDDIILAGKYTQVGNITKSQNGTGTFSTAGKSVATALTEIFSKRLQPSITSNPAVSITLTGAGTYEVGTAVTPRYSASLSTGSYTYGPATGITATSWSISDTNGNTAMTNSGSFSEFVVQDSTNYTVTATATHYQGAIAKDNLGSDSSPIVRIASGNKSKTSSSIKGFRKMFWGSNTTVQNADSASIRTNSSKAVATGTLNVTVVEGAKYVMIALPAARKISKVEDTGAFGTDIFGSFTLTENVMVEGLNGYTAAAYNIYEYKPSTALGSNTYKVTVI